MGLKEVVDCVNEKTVDPHKKHNPKLIAGPPCPACGSPMVERTAKKGKKAGRKFWGCPMFPDCRQTMPHALGKQMLQDLRDQEDARVAKLKKKQADEMAADDCGWVEFLDV